MANKARAALMAAAATGVVLGSALLASPAMAAPAGCTYYNACVWEDVSYKTDNTSNAVQFKLNIPDYTTWKYSNGHRVNDNALSVYNNGGSQDTYWYRDTYPSARDPYMFMLSPQQGDGNITNNSGLVGGFTNSISSGFFSSYKPGGV